VTERLVAAPASPYKGLTRFEDSELDALLFFGREREREVIAANLIASRLTVLYGVSGVGKSSLLRAGVARRLRELAPEATVVVYDTWTGDPARGLLDAVASAAPDAAPPVEGRSLTDALDGFGELYLILDQFEELFVYGLAAPFAEALGEVVTRPDLRVNVLIAVREDALAQLDVFTGRVPNVFSNYLPLDRLDRDAGRAAIEGPLGRYNELRPASPPVETEPGLVEAVLDEVAAGRVELAATGKGAATGVAGDAIEAPFLQLVMERLWEEETARGSTTLRLATLEALGGAEAIVQAHLERAVGALGSAEKDVAARIFHHLVTPSGTKIAHRVGDLAQYAGVRERELRPVLARLGEERILRPSDGRYEIFHDVLADAVLSWRTAHQARRDLARRHRRALAVAGGSLVLLAIMLAVTIFALAQRSEAREKARLARAEAREATARGLDAEAIGLLSADPELGLLLATQAARLSPTEQAEDVLRRALLASRVRRVFRTGSPVVAAAYSPNGRRLLVAGEDVVRLADTSSERVRTLRMPGRITAADFSSDSRFVLATDRGGTVRVWDVETGRRLQTIRHGAPIATAEFSPEGDRLATAGRDGALRIWRTADGTAVAAAELGTPLRKASFGPGGRLIIAVGNDSRARVVDAETGLALLSLDHGARVTDALISPTGKLMVTAGADGKVRIYGARGSRLQELRGHRGPVTAIAAQAQGRLLATASEDGTARVWTLFDGEQLALHPGHSSAVTSVEFSDDGFSVVTTSADGSAHIWQPSTGTTRAVLAGHTDTVTAADFSPNGRAVITASEDGTARTWTAQAQPQLDLLRRFDRAVLSAAISPDGELIAVAGPDGVRLLRASDGRPLRTLTRSPGVGVAFSSDGSLMAAALGTRAVVWRTSSGRLVRTFAHSEPVRSVALASGLVATASADRVGRLWSLDGRLVRSLTGHLGALTAIAFSPDGRRLVTGSSDRTARVWRTATGKQEHVLVGHRRGVTAVAFGSDGRTIATASRDEDVRTWNAATGLPLRMFRGHFGIVRDASLSRDGRWLVTAGPTTAGLWDAGSGARHLQLRGHDGALTTALFDPSGRTVVTASVDGTLRRYRCEVCGGLEALRDLAERRLRATGRKPTPTEVRRYFGG
jgi:WD40 repeat protein